MQITQNFPSTYKKKLTNQKKGYWKKFKIVLLLGLLIVTAKFCLKQTSSFTLSKIKHTSFAFSENLNSPEFPKDAFQRFKLYDKGKQCFAFLSEDEKYILKIYTKKTWVKSTLLKTLSAVPFLKDFAHKPLQIIEEKNAKLFNSLNIAYNPLRDNTGILYFHPCSSSSIHLTLIDKLNIEYEIDLGQSAFVLQRRGTLFFDFLSAQKLSGNRECSKKAITDLIDFLIYRSNLGINDKDPLLRKNFAIIDNSFVQIDIGSFYLSKEALKKEEQKKEFLRTIASLQEYIDNNYLELKSFIDNVIDDRIKKHFQ